jgi:hypothetical protein
MSKITKALVAALALAGVSVSVTANAWAIPYRGGWYQGWDAYQAPRHDPTNTNGSNEPQRRAAGGRSHRPLAPGSI